MHLFQVLYLVGFVLFYILFYFSTSYQRSNSNADYWQWLHRVKSLNKSSCLLTQPLAIVLISICASHLILSYLFFIATRSALAVMLQGFHQDAPAILLLRGMISYPHKSCYFTKPSWTSSQMQFQSQSSSTKSWCHLLLSTWQASRLGLRFTGLPFHVAWLFELHFWVSWVELSLEKEHYK